MALAAHGCSAASSPAGTSPRPLGASDASDASGADCDNDMSSTALTEPSVAADGATGTADPSAMPVVYPRCGASSPNESLTNWPSPTWLCSTTLRNLAKATSVSFQGRSKARHARTDLDAISEPEPHQLLNSSICGHPSNSQG